MKPQLFLLILCLACSKKPQELPKANSLSDSLLTSECEYPRLSTEFHIKTKFKRYIRSGSQDSSAIQLYLTEKATLKVADSILVTPGFLHKDVFTDCKNVMSYSTGYNTDMEIVDNHYGDIIIADLNFDNKEDIAVTNDSGGNGGTFYSYFIQTNAKTFTLNKFLTDSMIYFPTKWNNDERTLTTHVHAGACEVAENVYLFNENSNQWMGKSHKVINICGK